MESKFKLYDKVRDIASGYTGKITCIELRAEGFMYTVINEPAKNCLPVNGVFPEARLELCGDEKNKIGFTMKCN